MMNDKAVVLLSGGQDSTTCLYWANKRFKSVLAIGFDYGQNHINELSQARKIASDANIPYKIMDVKELLASSSLTEHSDHNEASYLNESLPASFTSGRNLLFLTIASSYGAEMGVTDIVTGVCQTDYNGFPDCRRTTIDSMQTTLSLGMGIGDIRIHTPLMYLTKAETWKLANELGILSVIIEDTMTDYDGDMTINEWGYGIADNPASKLRKKGFYEAKEQGWI